MAMWLVLWFHVMVYINTGCICYGAVVGTVVSRCGLYLHWLHLIWRCGFTRWSMSALAFFFSFLIVLWLDAWTIYLHWLWSGAVASRVGLHVSTLALFGIALCFTRWSLLTLAVFGVGLWFARWSWSILHWLYAGWLRRCDLCLPRL